MQSLVGEPEIAHQSAGCTRHSVPNRASRPCPTGTRGVKASEAHFMSFNAHRCMGYRMGLLLSHCAAEAVNPEHTSPDIGGLRLERVCKRWVTHTFRSTRYLRPRSTLSRHYCKMNLGIRLPCQLIGWLTVLSYQQQSSEPAKQLEPLG